MHDAPRKSPLHERNAHREGYDMSRLTAAFPGLEPYVTTSQAGTPTVNFSDIQAVTALNRAILAADYGMHHWSLPPGYLCPSVPGRADYIHYAADLMAAHNRGSIPPGPGIRVLDLGVGANAIYPIVGHHAYGWSFMGSDIDPVALQSAKENVGSSESLSENVLLRLQKNPSHYFKGIIGSDEEFDLVVCNPPFYANEAEANEASARKWKNLGKAKAMGTTRTFGGQSAELYCEGGEVRFIRKMMEESFFFARKCYWFTTLVSRQEHIHGLRRALQRLKPKEVQVIHMAQGQKNSRILAWTFLSPEQQRDWRARRFWD